MGSLSPLHWLVVLIIVVLVFGTKKLRNVGKDLGAAVHDFKEGIREGSEHEKKDDVPQEVKQTDVSDDKKTDV